ncbi:hypothetical protein L798_08116 [Zootermopsis nevadensis]|uniref:Uncharacterized protein n=1 Tax=Zootermopsis nevadensis TaxID=136037 RepID=A0A067RWR2_ZOONE|nr:hypothetical protein L798_08116 [Zootermopsis nevadensis]
MNPPVISVLGFANINRRLFASHASAMLTYLIVLLQMKMGEAEPNKM